eukprot:SAG11_NODE_5088_length_1667_cov_1.860332_1_plen_98_part_00
MITGEAKLPLRLGAALATPCLLCCANIMRLLLAASVAVPHAVADLKHVMTSIGEKLTAEQVRPMHVHLNLFDIPRAPDLEHQGELLLMRNELRRRTR